MVFIPSKRLRTHSKKSCGQSMAEFALILPVILLIVLVAVDFGRAFYAWVTVTNATRVAANYAAGLPDDTYPSADYSALVQGETPDDSICPVVINTYNPAFIDGPDTGTFAKDVGDSAQVSVSCTFRVLTPVIGAIVGNAITIGARSTFPIRVGATP